MAACSEKFVSGNDLDIVLVNFCSNGYVENASKAVEKTATYERD